MSDGILPALFVLLKVGKPGGNVGVDLAQCGPFLSAVLNRHGDQRDVAEGWLLAGRIVVADASVTRGTGGPFRRRGRRGGSRGRRRITVGGAMENSARRRSLVLQMMMSGARRVHRHYGIRAVQAVVRMMGQGCVRR